MARRERELFHFDVIPGARVTSEPQMRDCASGNLEIPDSMLRSAPD
jgi:hypothetical protein